MPRVLILGGTGMLGHKVFQFARDRFPETWCTIRSRLDGSGLDRIGLSAPADRIRENVDVMDWRAVSDALQELRPDVVVNCVGIVKQRAEAKAAIPSITINALLPHRLAAALADWSGRLVHISTDCVFSGRRGHYTEDDVPDAEDLYGRSKLLGEVTAANAVTIRTSMIGRELREHRALLDWLLQQDGRTIKGFRRAFYSGLTTNELARVICRIIEDHPRLSGLYQVTSETITKYDLLTLIVDTFGLGIRVEPDDEFFCDRSLVGDRFRKATGYHCPPWTALVRDLHADPTPYRTWQRQDETI
jgi:dTDP-4-dehydrorhamnose reductase